LIHGRGQDVGQPRRGAPGVDRPDALALGECPTQRCQQSDCVAAVAGGGLDEVQNQDRQDYEQEEPL
jgi:hypothetical protein